MRYECPLSGQFFRFLFLFQSGEVHSLPNKGIKDRSNFDQFQKFSLHFTQVYILQVIPSNDYLDSSFVQWKDL